MIRAGLIGYGRWGPNLARCMAANPAFALKVICDLSPERLTAATVEHGGVRVGREPDALVNDPDLDAIVVATPATTHYAIVRAALATGKHVLVEKPIALASQEVTRLIAEADRRRCVLMIDHTYLFSPPIRAIGRAVRAGELGTIRSLESVRVNAGGGPHDVNVVWDLAYHDVSIIDDIVEGVPWGVSATGRAAESGGREYCAQISLHFPGGMIANIRVDRSGPAKVRQLLVDGSEGTLSFDDLQPTDKITMRANGARNAPVGHDGAIATPPFGDGEPLQAVVDHFASCILGGTRPRSDGTAGLRVVRLLEAASRSIANAGRIVALSEEGVV